ncbi:MAG: TolC family protein [Desulfuromonadales bacterium]|nr:TolC family protein [Desulfuromonadales bacterium]
MRRIALISLVAVWFPSVVVAADVELKLRLSEAIKMAAEKNLDVRAEYYNPAQFEAAIHRNKSIYDPLLSFDTTYGDSTSPTLSSSGSTNGQIFDINASLSQLFWTGATGAIVFQNNYTNTNSVVLSNQHFWQSQLGATLSQPLLKNSGREATEVNISISRLSKYASIEHLNSRLINTVAQVRNEYFKLYSLREQLEVRKVSLELARKILGETKSRVNAGVLPAMEILNAEFGSFSREKDVIDAEKAVNDQLDVLRLLLQLEGRGDIVVVDLPTRDLYQVSEEEMLTRALSRPDIKELKRNLEINELQTRVYGNNIKPDLRLMATAGVSALEKTYPRDMEKIGALDTPYWTIGLNFSYPFGNRAAENDYRKSRLKTEQTALQIKSLEASAVNDVKAAIRGITVGYKQIEVADRGRIYAEERLKAFIRKNEVGLATTKDVLDVENDLAAAKNNQIAALVAYNNAITQLWQVNGEILEREGIHVVEDDMDRLYKNTR